VDVTAATGKEAVVEPARSVVIQRDEPVDDRLGVAASPQVTAGVRLFEHCFHSGKVVNESTEIAM
jgi:hypothetical protein